jgi:probable phosphoglycerate mutase
VVDEAEVEPSPRTLVGWDTDLGEPSTFLLLRHGTTNHTLDKRFSGYGGEDPPLSPEGAREARAVADRLVRDGGVDALVSSPMRRAKETAEVVGSALGLDVRVVDGLRECAFGAWEGRTFAEVKQGWPAELVAWLGDPGVAPPGGESFDDVRRRVQLARDQLLARYPGRTVLVVTHVTPIKLLVREALDAPMPVLYRMELTPASLSEIHWFANGTASMRRFNDGAHLRSWR